MLVLYIYICFEKRNTCGLKVGTLVNKCILRVEMPTYMMFLCAQMSTSVRPTPARMVARAQTLSTATRVNALVGSLELRVRSVKNTCIVFFNCLYSP